MTAIHINTPAPCYLLLVPLEIRQSIYRNLLLDPFLAYLSPQMEGVLFDNRNLSDTNDLFGNEVDDNAAQLLWKDTDDKDDDGSQNGAERSAAKRFPAILRVNHQVYAEASSLMYSDLEIVLQPEDVMDFDHRTDIVKQNKQEWRRNLLPPKGEGGRYLEPYIFERFQRIGFCTNFFSTRSHQRTPEWTLFVGKEVTVRFEDRANYASFLTATRTMQNLAQLLSMNTVIKRLNYSLFIEPDLDSDVDNLAPRQAVEIYDKECEVAYERATGVFLEAGMLDPLRELSNVEIFQFVVQTLDGKDKALKLQRKHAAIVWEAKQTIERNYSAKQDCLNVRED